MTLGAARSERDLSTELPLATLEARRDRGFAGDCVEALWLMLQQDEPDDHVVATGESHSVRELAGCAFAALGLDWRRHVTVDPGLPRPAEVGRVARRRHRGPPAPGLGAPRAFPELIRTMVAADVDRLAAARFEGNHG